MDHSFHDFLPRRSFLHVFNEDPVRYGQENRATNKSPAGRVLLPSKKEAQG
jgi:hypothetical protein